MSIRWIIPILSFFILLPADAYAGDQLKRRIVRPADSALRDRLATAHIVRDEPVEVMAIFPDQGDASAADFYNAGKALLMTGRFTRAAESFEKAISTSKPDGESRPKAIEQFLRITEYNPGLDLPMPSNEVSQLLAPDISLHLSGYLAGRGENEKALDIITGTTFLNGDETVISEILRASHLAALEGWDASAKAIGRIRARETSPLVDLLYLTRGYHYLQDGQPERARSSFNAIFPSSPYSPEALLGKAWSLIRTGDLQGAAVVLEELVDRHPYSHAASEGVLDLALSYRELGLYEKAGKILDGHLRRLEEVRNWLLGLKKEDLQTGSENITFLRQALEGTVPDRESLSRTPYFVRQWIMDISADPYVGQTTALIKGLGLVGQKAARLRRRFDGDSAQVKREIEWVKGDVARALGTRARLEELRNRLEYINSEMSATLQDFSLGGFASEKTRMLLSKTGELKMRLSLMENSVSKAEGFTSLVGRLSESIAASEEETQLNQIRKHAYDGLISSRVTLRNLRNTLTALEGRLWLEVKGGAVQLERKTSLRVNSGKMRAGQTLADISKTIRLLNSRLQKLEELDALLLERKNDLDTAFTEKLEVLGKKIDGMRADRLMDLAVQAADKIRETEARVLYTSADIEISRMESTIRSLQEAVE